MKIQKPLVFTLILFVLKYHFLFSQPTQLDLLIGNSNVSGRVMGLAIKNAFKGTGFYFHTNLTGTAYTGETGFDYGSISDHTEIRDEGIVEHNSYGMTFGITHDLSSIISKVNSGLTLFVGTGYSVNEEVSQRYEYYRWDCCPSLNEGNLITWISSSETVPVFEILLGYDFIKTIPLRFNMSGGYSTMHGMVFIVGIGFIQY